MIAAIILVLACVSTEPQSYAEKNGWIEMKSPRPDIQCWYRDRGSYIFCTKSLNSTHGAFNGNN